MEQLGKRKREDEKGEEEGKQEHPERVLQYMDLALAQAAEAMENEEVRAVWGHFWQLWALALAN